MIDPRLTQIHLLPSMSEVTVGQQVLAEYCGRMMQFGKETNAAEIYDYFRRLADVVSDPGLSMLVAPLIFKADKIWEEHIRVSEEANRPTVKTEAYYGKPKISR